MVQTTGRRVRKGPLVEVDNPVRQRASLPRLHHAETAQHNLITTTDDLANHEL
jgi:hypothetical protein